MNITENLTQNLTCETAIRAFKTKFREEMLGESSFASHTSTPMSSPVRVPTTILPEKVFFFSYHLNNIYLVTALLMTILTFTWRENKNNVQERKEKYNVTAFTTN